MASKYSQEDVIKFLKEAYQNKNDELIKAIAQRHGISYSVATTWCKKADIAYKTAGHAKRDWEEIKRLIKE